MPGSRWLARGEAAPEGDRLTSRRFLQLGLKLGDSAGFEQIHHIVELPLGSRAFLHDMDEGVRFAQPSARKLTSESS